MPPRCLVHQEKGAADWPPFFHDDCRRGVTNTPSRAPVVGLQWFRTGTGISIDVDPVRECQGGPPAARVGRYLRRARATSRTSRSCVLWARRPSERGAACRRRCSIIVRRGREVARRSVETAACRVSARQASADRERRGSQGSRDDGARRPGRVSTSRRLNAKIAVRLDFLHTRRDWRTAPEAAPRAGEQHG